jgi:putative ribosome biogenesis GTPase RsgA
MAASGEKEKQNSLWQKTLNDVAKQDSQKNSTVILLGNKGVGKRSLINAVN